MISTMILMIISAKRIRFNFDPNVNLKGELRGQDAITAPCFLLYAGHVIEIKQSGRWISVLRVRE